MLSLREKTDLSGSFMMWGIGLLYEYNPHKNRISIIQTRHHKPVLDVYLDAQEDTCLTPRDFIQFLEKSLQIHALMLSNNETIDITEIMSLKKLRSFLENALVTTSMACLLEQGDYRRFTEIFCERYHFQSFSLRQSHSWIASDKLFIATLETRHQNKISGEGHQLHNCLFSLSKSLVSDLIILEMDKDFRQNAHTILTASTKLSTLALIMNKGLEPRRRIIKKSGPKPPENGQKTAIKTNS